MRSLSMICAYSCGVLVFGLLVLSFMSIAPAGESFFAAVAAIEAGAAVIFAVLALVFRKRDTVSPPWLVSAFQSLAAAVTVLVLLFSVG